MSSHKKRKSKKKKKLVFANSVSSIKKSIKAKKPRTVLGAIRLGIKVGKKFKGKIKSKPRVIKVPKSGGFLPLIPLFSALGALGSLAGGASAIYRAVKTTKEAQQKLDEAKRHNKQMEAVSVGNGAFLKPHQKGLGIFLD